MLGRDIRKSGKDCRQGAWVASWSVVAVLLRVVVLLLAAINALRGSDDRDSGTVCRLLFHNPIMSG